MLLADLMKEFQFDMECNRFSSRTIITAVNSTKAFIITPVLRNLKKSLLCILNSIFHIYRG